MSQDPWSSVQHEAQFHTEFLLGQQHYKQGDLTTALGCFKAAYQSVDFMHAHARAYMSYLGITQVLLNDVSGLNLCRQAAQEELHAAEIFENLVRAELKLGHRKRACDALRRGLRVDKGHPGLRALRDAMGVRRGPCLSFLDRDNPLNRLLGKMTYPSRFKRAKGR